MHECAKHVPFYSFNTFAVFFIKAGFKGTGLVSTEGMVEDDVICVDAPETGDVVMTTHFNPPLATILATQQPAGNRTSSTPATSVVRPSSLVKAIQESDIINASLPVPETCQGGDFTGSSASFAESRSSETGPQKRLYADNAKMKSRVSTKYLLATLHCPLFHIHPHVRTITHTYTHIHTPIHMHICTSIKSFMQRHCGGVFAARHRVGGHAAVLSQVYNVDIVCVCVLPLSPVLILRSIRTCVFVNYKCRLHSATGSRTADAIRLACLGR
jgi:hypothetical protein